MSGLAISVLPILEPQVDVYDVLQRMKMGALSRLPKILPQMPKMHDELLHCLVVAAEEELSCGKRRVSHPDFQSLGRAILLEQQ